MPCHSHPRVQDLFEGKDPLQSTFFTVICNSQNSEVFFFNLTAQKSCVFMGASMVPGWDNPTALSTLGWGCHTSAHQHAPLSLVQWWGPVKCSEGSW